MTDAGQRPRDPSIEISDAVQNRNRAFSCCYKGLQRKSFAFSLRWGVFSVDTPLESSREGCPPRPSQNRTWCVTPSGSQPGAFTHVTLHVKQANRGVMISSAQCRHLFPLPVIPNRCPLAPSELPDFIATMDTSDFHQPILSPSLFTLVQKLLSQKPTGGSPGLP